VRAGTRARVRVGVGVRARARGRVRRVRRVRRRGGAVGSGRALARSWCARQMLEHSLAKAPAVSGRGMPPERYCGRMDSEYSCPGKSSVCPGQ